MYINRQQIRTLDELPFLDRTAIDYDRYHSSIAVSGTRYSMAMYASRGCPYRCVYCDVYRLNKHHYRRSAEHIFEEVKLLNSIGVRRFDFMDDIFNVNVKECTKFFQLVIKHGIDARFHFPVGLRGDLLNREIIDLMAEGGTAFISVALETASPRLQQLIKKKLDLEKFYGNVQYLTERHPNIVLGLYAMFGFPTETEKEALMTLDFIQDIKWIDFPNVTTLRIFPGSEVEQLAVDCGVPEHLIQKNMGGNFYDHTEGNLVFDAEFSVYFRRKLLKDYFLNKERLLNRVPYQMRCYTEEELNRRYSKYLHSDKIKTYQDALRIARIKPIEFPASSCVEISEVKVDDIAARLKREFPLINKKADALRIMLIDLSNDFSVGNGFDDEWDDMQPLGLMALSSYLNVQPFAAEVDTKIYKSTFDYRSNDELVQLVSGYQPDIIGFRVLSLHKQFLHKTVAHLRDAGISTPVIVGGPHATNCSNEVLMDANISLTVVGEGEHTLAELVQAILENGKRMPSAEKLMTIQGVGLRNNTMKSLGVVSLIS